MVEPIEWYDDLTRPRVESLSDQLVALMWALAELHVARLRVHGGSYQAEKLESAMRYIRGQIEGHFRDRTPAIPEKIPGNSEEGRG